MVQVSGSAIDDRMERSSGGRVAASEDGGGIAICDDSGKPVLPRGTMRAMTRGDRLVELNALRADQLALFSKREAVSAIYKGFFRFQPAATPGKSEMACLSHIRV
jgi:hypothetical protein